MKKRFMFLVILIVFIISNQILALSVGDNVPIQIQTTNASGGIVTGTFEITINISNSDTCSPVLYSNVTTKTTDSRGIVSYNLEDVNLSFDEQYWFCYYRDGVLKDTTKIARIPYSFRTKNITLGGIVVDSNLNMTNYNVTSDYGFFDYLGSLVNRITKLFVVDINASGNVNIGGDLNVSGTIYGNTSAMNVNNSDFFDGYDSTFFMPLNTSVSGDFDFNGGWQNGGVSISGGDIFVQTGYFYNITSLNVTKQDLTITENLTILGHLFSNGTGNNYFMGNVGIGTSSPNQKLEVEGNANITGNLTLGEGIIKYNDAISNYQYYNGTAWLTFNTLSSIPAGTIAAFNNETCPDGWIPANGSSGTPDLRGIFIRGAGTSGVIDYANGTDMSATYGEYLNDSFQYHKHSTHGYVYSAPAGLPGAGEWFTGGYYQKGTWGVRGQDTHVVSGPTTGGAIYGDPRIGAETRPASYVLTYCVKTSDDSPVTAGLIGSSGNNVFLQDTSKNFGVGTTSPSVKLEVSGDVNITGTYYGDGSGITGVIASSTSWNRSGTNIYLAITSDKVGIGTTTPQQKLNVVGNANVTGNLTLGQKITFAFGEIIDNLVNGWIEITGNLKVEGNANITGNLGLGKGKIMFNETSKRYDYYNGSMWKDMSMGNVPANAIMSFNQATCPTGWILADGTAGTPDLTALDLTQKNVSRMRAVRSTSQSFPNLGYTTVLWDTEIYDNLGEYNNATGVFTATKAGYYQVNALLRSASVSWDTGERAMMLMYKNDVSVVMIDYQEVHYTAATYLTLHGGDIIYLDAGDNIKIVVWHDQDGAVNFRTGATDSYFAVDYFGISPNTSMIYCMKTSEDSETSNTIWATSGDDVILNNASKNVDLAGNLTVGGNLTIFGDILGPAPVTNAARVVYEYQFTEDNELDYSSNITDSMAAATITFSELPANTVAIHVKIRMVDSGVNPQLRYKRSSGAATTFYISSQFADTGLNALAINQWIPTNGNSIYVTGVNGDNTADFLIIGYKVGEQ